MIQNRTLLCLLSLGLGIGVQAQESAVSAGGDASGSGGKVAYSVGQTLYSSHSASTGSVTNGVQQPYEISTVLGLDYNEVLLSLNAYPNPTLGDLTLSVSGKDLSALRVQLFDMRGKMLDQRSITGTTENFSLQNLPAAVYFMKVTKDNAEVKTFKIVKN